MTDDENPVTVSDLGPSEGHRTRWGSPYGTDAVAVLAWIIFLWLLFVVVILS